MVGAFRIISAGSPSQTDSSFTLLSLVLLLVVFCVHSASAANGAWQTGILLKATSDPLEIVWTSSSSSTPARIFLMETGNGITCGSAELVEAEQAAETMKQGLYPVGSVNPSMVNPSQVASSQGAYDLIAPIGANDFSATYNLRVSANKCTAVLSDTTSRSSFVITSQTTGGAAPIAYEQVQAFDIASIAGEAMGGAIIVCLIPLVVVIILMPCGFLTKKFSKKAKSFMRWFVHFMNAFGCGALLAVVALHLYPEMVLGLANSGVEMWRGGALVLAGVCAVAVIHLVADAVSGLHSHPEHHHVEEVEDAEGAHDSHASGPGGQQQVPANGEGRACGGENLHQHDHRAADDSVEAIEDGDVEKGAVVKVEVPQATAIPTTTTVTATINRTRASIDSDDGHEQPLIRMGTCRDVFRFGKLHPLVWGVTIGDALHNFVDGTIIATAFFACGPATGWATISATVAHEVPKELGSISVMISKGTTVGQALFFNLVAQAFAILGCGIVLAIGNTIPESQTALLLAFGIGTFLFIALTDIMPLLLEVHRKGDYIAVTLGIMTAFTTLGFALSSIDNDGCSQH